MIFIPVRRATLLIPSGPSNNPNQKHLFILLTDPQGVDGKLLLVGVSTLRAGLPHDPTCTLYPGDHPFIRNDSYINFRHARIECADKLVRGVRQGLFLQKDTLDSAIFARVCKGLLESRHTIEKIKMFYQSTCHT
jgi:hypothetical protein